MTRIANLRPVRGRRLSEAEMITNSRVVSRCCLLPLAALAVGGLAVFTPMSSAGAASGNAASEFTGSRCVTPTPPSNDNSGGDNPIGALPTGVTSFVSGLTENRTASTLGLLSFEKNKVGRWNPAPAGPVAAHGKNQWCAESSASIFGGTSVKLTYTIRSTAPSPGLPVDFIIFQANVTATGGGSESCQVVRSSGNSTTECSVQVVNNGQPVIETPSGRPFLAVDFVVSQRGH
jgi:hypothetical protein